MIAACCTRPGPHLSAPAKARRRRFLCPGGPGVAPSRPSPSNGFKVIPLGHMKSADRVNLASASTATLENSLGMVRKPGLQKCKRVVSV